MQTTRKALLASLLISMTVVLGVALAGVPNVELMTLNVFVAGYLLGWRLGMVVGAVSIAGHSIFNPLGAALPPLLVGQIIGFSVIGMTGALAGRLIVQLKPRWLGFLSCGVVGLALTLFYDVLANIGAYYTITGDQAPSSLVKFVVAGLAFMVMHVIWNTTLFLVVLNPVLRILARYRGELSEGR